MIKLDFKLSPDWNRSLTPNDLAVASAVDLRYRYFNGDVYFFVNEYDYSAAWGWVPILDFAMSVLQIEKGLRCDEGYQEFEFTESDESLTFVRIGLNVSISSSYTDAKTRIPILEFSSSVHEFATKVALELTNFAPSLTRNAVFVNFLNDLAAIRLIAGE